MKHLRAFKKFAAILANLSLVLNNFLPLLWLVQPVYANTSEGAVPTIIEDAQKTDSTISEIQSNQEPTPTPEPTASTSTPTISPQPTPTPEATPTANPTITPTPEATPSTTPTSEPTPKITPTPEATPTATPTPIPTVTVTETPVPNVQNSQLKSDKNENEEVKKSSPYRSNTLSAPQLNNSGQYSISSTSGIWTSVNGGDYITGLNTKEVRWGSPVGYYKSGLKFNGVDTQSFNPNEKFLIGDLTHFNWATYAGTSAEGATLKITLNFSNPSITPSPTFSYNFNIEETKNTSGLGGCKYYGTDNQVSDTPCDDIITFPNAYGDKEFTIGDIKYTLKIDGFQNAYPVGSLVSKFVTEEEKDNKAYLVGHLSSVLVERPAISIVKKVNGEDANTAPGIYIGQGETANFTYIVQNTGNVQLTNIKVTDNKGVSVSCLSTQLAAGASMTCTGSSTAILGLYTNIGTATGTHSNGTVTAQDPANYTGVEKVDICHATGSHDNPYSDAKASMTADAGGHDGHNGPVWYPGINVTWGDIIPPFDYDGGRYPGKNYDAYGQSILENGCKIPSAKLIVKKSVFPSTDTTNFSITATGTASATGAPAFLNGSTGTISQTQSHTFTVSPGTYSVTETIPEGWKQTDNTCTDIVIKNGESKECTITNSKGATLTLVKTVINNNGGTKQISDFNLYIGDTKVTSGATNQIEAGTYTVREDNLTGYNASNWGGYCAPNGQITLISGDVKTCTITNDDIAPSLTLVKSLDLKYGGQAKISDFTLKANDTVFTSGTPQDVNVGTYTLSESTGLTGYQAGNWSCTNGISVSNDNKINLSLGQSTTCTITNSDLPAALTACKFNDKDGDGVKDSDENMLPGWTMALSGPTSTSGITQEVSGCVTFSNLSAGNYSVTETNTTGWHPVTGLTQNVTLGLNDSKTVYFGNQQLGSIVVHKDVVGPNSEDIDDTTNNFKVSLNNLNEETITDGGTVTYDGLVAGSNYTISESFIPAGYEFVSLSVNGQSVSKITVLPGQATHVYIVNKQKPSQLTLTKQIATGLGTASPNDFNLTVNNVGVTSAVVYNYPAHQNLVMGETILSGYTFDKLVCVSSLTNSANNFESSLISKPINLTPGESVSCTITNTNNYGKIIIKKQTQPSTDPTQFSFTGTGVNADTKLSHNQTAEKIVAPGNYSVTETGLLGWDLANIVCDDSDSTKNGSSASINVGNNETVTCTFTNTKQASLTVVKNVINDNGGAKTVSDFDIKFNNTTPTFDNGTVSGHTTKYTALISGIKPGTYSLSENTNVLGYQAGSWSCDGANQFTGGNITLNPGENVTCTITNNDIAPKLTVTKIVNNTFGNLKVSDFSLFVGSQSVVSGVQNQFNAGNYVVGEDNQPGYTGVISGNCSNNGAVTLAPGDEKACIITNTDVQGKIIIEKQTLPDGDQTEFSFSGTGINEGVSLKDGGTTEKIVVPGSYTVTELVPSGWDLTSISCGNDTDSTGNINTKTASINVSANETVKCTFTNTKRGKIIIEKNAINDSNQSFRFTNNFGNNNSNEFALVDDATTGLPKFEAEVLPGQYTVTEDAYESWKLTDINCTDPTQNSSGVLNNRQASINVSPGETVTCTFTNRQKPTLTVVKKVINDNGGTKTVNDFGIAFSGGDLSFDIGITSGDTTTYTAQKLTLDKGTSYTLSENNIEGYAEGNWDCGTTGENKLSTTVELGYNQNLTCTITNDDQPGTLIVKKTVNNANGGDLAADDFNFTVNGGQSTAFEADGENQLTVDAGIYTVTEVLVDGYEPSYNNCSDIAITNGGTATCTITNNAIFNQVVVTKFNDKDGDGLKDEDEEVLPNWQINLTSQTSKTTNSAGQVTFDKILPGTYHLSETLQSGWEQTPIFCDNESTTPDPTPTTNRDIITSLIKPAIAIENNQNNYRIVLTKSQSLQCFIGNRQLSPELTIAKTNNVGSSVLSPGNSVTYTIKLNVSQSDISNLKVTDLLSNGFKYRSGSYKITKNGTDITSQVAEPQYHSPGVWSLGSVVKDDQLKLTYIADIDTNQQSGTYKDIAWAVGNNTYHQDETVLASALPEGYLDVNFVGTQVPINKPVSNSVSAEVERIQTVEGRVLGISTDTLPATGAATIWLIISSLLGLTGLALIFDRQHTMTKKIISGFLLAFIGYGFVVSPIQAISPNLFIRLQEPKAYVNTTDLNLKFVTLDIAARPITVKCFKKGPTESAFSQFGADIAVTAGGNSDQCNLASVINTPGTYQFKTEAYADTETAVSNSVFFDYQNSTPGTPTEYSKSVLDNHCDYTIKFRTANDDGRTVKVEIYRSTNPAFSANNESLVHSISVGSDQFREVNNSVPDCSQTYYYAIRAFDTYGNGSGVIGDTLVKTVVSGDTTIVTATNPSPAAGAIRVSDSNIPQEGSGENSDSDNDQADQDNSSGEVLGTGSQVGKNYFADHKILTTIIIIACLAGIIYVIKTASKSKKV